MRYANMRDDLNRRPAEAAYSIVNGFKDLKKTVYAGEFKNCRGARRHPCKLNVAITLHGFFKATEKHVDSRPVHFANPGTIEHEAGPVDIHAAFQFAEEDSTLLRVH
jgi:hypothetical protein